MDPPGRPGPPRKRDRVKGWLKGHFTGSTTPSPGLSPAPSQTKASRIRNPQPSHGTTSPQDVDASPSTSGKVQGGIGSDEPAMPPVPNDPLAVEEANQKDTGDEDAIDTTSQDKHDFLNPNPAPKPPQPDNSVERDTVDDNREKGSSPPYELPSTGRKIYEGVKTSLRAIERATDVFTPLKSTAAALLIICDTIDAYGKNREEFERLLKRVEVISSIMGSWPKDASQGAEDRFSGLSRTLVDMKNLLLRKVDENRSKLERAMLTAQDGEEVVKLTREIELAMEIALFEATATNECRTLQVVDGIGWIKDRFSIIEETSGTLRSLGGAVEFLWKTELLKKLGSVDGGEYNNPERGSECVPGTRLALLSMLIAWAEDRQSSHLFWLNGLAGTGKTAVAKTFCLKLHGRGLLGATFFCTLKESELRNVYLIIPTLAKILAQEHPKFGAALQQVLAEDGTCRNPTKMQLKDQYTKLILQPAEVAFGSDEVVVFCVDALDECDDKDAIEGFLAAILSQTPTTAIKFFLTSRPERSLRHPFKLSTQHKSLRLHEIDAKNVHADISLFLDNCFKRNVEIYEHYQKSWPPPEIEKIADYSGNLFIVASTAFKYITSSNGMCVHRFQQFIQRSSDLKSKGVDTLYHGILVEAFKDLEDDEKTIIHSGLSLLVAAQKPLSVHDYGKILGTTTQNVRGAFNALHSVVRVPEDGQDGATISIFHASFVDYLTAEKLRTHGWAVVISVAHSVTAEACFSIMDSQLRMGISGVQTSYKSNADQSNPLSLPTELAYACTAWGEHVLYAGFTDQWHSKLRDFINGEMVLYWLEALSVVTNVQYAYTILWRLSKILGPSELGSQLGDIGDFAHNFQTPISHSAPHLYLSALPFYAAIKNPSQVSFPALNAVPKVHHRRLGGRQTLSISTGGHVLSTAFSPDSKYFVVSGDIGGSIHVFNTQTGQSPLEPLRGHTECVRSVAFSPDGRHIVSGSEDATIRVWNAQTGLPASDPLIGHTNWVNSVAFSPDGRYIVSGSTDKTVRVWDALTGQPALEPIVVFRHTGTVTSVAFSPDGRYIVSGSGDKTVRVWNAHRSQPAKTVTGLNSWVWSVAFSPDGRYIVCGLEDRTIGVLDAQTGQPILEPITGHTDRVKSAVFSPDGTLIVSGSEDQTGRVWDARTGQPALDPFTGHTGAIKSVGFSLDGRHVVTGSGDGIVCVWDVQTGRPPLDPSTGHTTTDSLVGFSSDGCHVASGLYEQTVLHTDCVRSVAFSPDGKHIVSGSDDHTVRVWDTETGLPGTNLPGQHSHVIWSVAFSPDGRHIVSGSADETVRVWDAQTGRPALEPFTGHEGPVNSVAFSPNGRRIVSCSDDHTIRVWDAETGLPASDTMKGHSSWVWSVAFSPDGRYIASCSADKTIRIWDAQTGQPASSPFTGHTDTVSSVAFSPNGRHVVSGSYDKSVEVWDVESGRRTLETIRGHMAIVSSVAFSPDGRHVVSGSVDRTVRVWDAQTGQSACDPFTGHTKGVYTVEFSPNGNLIVSGSADKSIRVWELPPPHLQNSLLLQAIPRFIGKTFLHEYPHGCVTLSNEGWLKNTKGELLMWIPPSCHEGLFRCGLKNIIGNVAATKIKLSNAVYHGEHWLKCRDPPPEDHTEHVYWPIILCQTVEAAPL